MLAINVLLRIPQQNVHIGINALKSTLVLSLTPLQANNKLSADSAETGTLVLKDNDRGV